MGKVCTVCGHVERTQIDELLRSGTTYRKLSEMFHLSLGALSRNAQDHVTFPPDQQQVRKVVREVAINDPALRQAVGRVRKQVTLDVEKLRGEVLACLEDLQEMRESLTKKNVILKLSTVTTIIKAIEMVLKNAQMLGIDLSSAVDQHEVIVQMPERMAR